MLFEMEFQRAFCLGFNSLEGMAGMASKLVQLYCTERVTYHMQIPGFGVTIRIKKDIMKFLRNFPSLGSTLKHI